MDSTKHNRQNFFYFHFPFFWEWIKAHNTHTFLLASRFFSDESWIAVAMYCENNRFTGCVWIKLYNRNGWWWLGKQQPTTQGRWLFKRTKHWKKITFFIRTKLCQPFNLILYKNFEWIVMKLMRCSSRNSKLMKLFFIRSALLFR